MRVKKLQSLHEVALELYLAGGQSLGGAHLAGHGLDEEVVVCVRGVVRCGSVCTPHAALDALKNAVIELVHVPHGVAAEVGHLVVALAQRKRDL